MARDHPACTTSPRVAHHITIRRCTNARVLGLTTYIHSFHAKNSKERTLRKIKPCFLVYMCPTKSLGHMHLLVRESILNAFIKVQYPIIMFLHLPHLSMLLWQRFYILRIFFFNFSLILCIFLDFIILYATLFVQIYSALCIWRLFDALGIFSSSFYIFPTFFYYFMYLLYIFWINKLILKKIFFLWKLLFTMLISHLWMH